VSDFHHGESLHALVIVRPSPLRNPRRRLENGIVDMPSNKCSTDTIEMNEIESK
jgi:hypothetical protein